MNQNTKEEYKNGSISISEEEVMELENIKEDLRTRCGCMVKDPLEKKIYYFLSIIALPYLEEHVSRKNPTLYKAYHGNFCRHASLLACYILKRKLPEWSWNVYEVDYTATLFGNPYRCVHAFVLGEKDGKFRAVDMWDDLSLKLYVEVDSKRYPFEYDELEKDRELLSMETMDFDGMCLLTDELLIGNVPEFLHEVDTLLDIADLSYFKNV